MTHTQRRVSEFIRRFEPGIARLGRAALAWMRKKYPRANVYVYDTYNALVFGFVPRDGASEAPFSIVMRPTRVVLCFLFGTQLPDPRGKLSGAGSRVRSIRLQSNEVFTDPYVAKLVALAAAQADVPEGSRPYGTMQIREEHARARPRRP